MSMPNYSYSLTICLNSKSKKYMIDELNHIIKGITDDSYKDVKYEIGGADPTSDIAVTVNKWKKSKKK